MLADPNRGSILGRGSSVSDLLLGDLTPTDFAILSVALELNRFGEFSPTASMIQRRLDDIGWPLGKTQLYNRLSFLCELGFLSAGLWNHPKRFVADQSTIVRGAREWLVIEKNRIQQAAKELDARLQLLHGTKPSQLASIIETEVGYQKPVHRPAEGQRLHGE
ncbi:MAG: hypothetical protein ACW99U_12145 [Candidatus Thorarchaeota archaeon]